MPNFSVSALLRQLPYFAPVDDAFIGQLAAQAVHRTFQPDEAIFWEGEASAGLCVVEYGRIKAYKVSPDGHEYILRFFGPGDTFNELAALDGAANPVNTMAMTEASVWVIDTAVFTAALQEDHQLCLAVLRGLVGRVRHIVGRMEDLALRPVTARLANFLLNHEEPASANLSHPAITRTLIANHLATTPESISRSLRVLEQAGAIRFDRQQILIVDLNILRDQAKL